MGPAPAASLRPEQPPDGTLPASARPDHLGRPAMFSNVWAVLSLSPASAGRGCRAHARRVRGEAGAAPRRRERPHLDAGLLPSVLCIVKYSRAADAGSRQGAWPTSRRSAARWRAARSFAATDRRRSRLTGCVALADRAAPGACGSTIRRPTSLALCRAVDRDRGSRRHRGRDRDDRALAPPAFAASPTR